MWGAWKRGPAVVWVLAAWGSAALACAPETEATDAGAAPTGCAVEQGACVAQGASVCCPQSGARVVPDAGCVEPVRVHFCSAAPDGNACGGNTALSCYTRSNGEVFLTGTSWSTAGHGLTECDATTAAGARALPACP